MRKKWRRIKGGGGAKIESCVVENTYHSMSMHMLCILNVLCVTWSVYMLCIMNVLCVTWCLKLCMYMYFGAYIILLLCMCWGYVQFTDDPVVILFSDSGGNVFFLRFTSVTFFKWNCTNAY